MFIVEIHTDVNYVKISTNAQQWQIYVADNNTTCVGQRVLYQTLHCNKSMFDCSWRSLAVKFG
jgi:hypothetical protein